MPVVRRGDHQCVDREVVQSAAKILGELGRSAALGFGQAIDPRRFEVGIGVAQISDAAIGPLREASGDARPRFRSPTMANETRSLAGAPRPRRHWGEWSARLRLRN